MDAGGDLFRGAAGPDVTPARTGGSRQRPLEFRPRPDWPCGRQRNLSMRQCFRGSTQKRPHPAREGFSMPDHRHNRAQDDSECCVVLAASDRPSAPPCDWNTRSGRLPSHPLSATPSQAGSRLPSPGPWHCGCDCRIRDEHASHQSLIHAQQRGLQACDDTTSMTRSRSFLRSPARHRQSTRKARLPALRGGQPIDRHGKGCLRLPAWGRRQKIEMPGVLSPIAAWGRGGGPAGLPKSS